MKQSFDRFPLFRLHAQRTVEADRFAVDVAVFDNVKNE
jgi:hypothetical protein